MSVRGGYVGKILDVNLTKREINKTDVDDEWAVKWIGGRGWGARIIWEDLVGKTKLDPLGPENVLIIAPGPLTGVLTPSASRTQVAAISPATGIYGDSNIGGKFGVEIKQAGYDAIVFRGRADKPLYLYVDDDVVELRDAVGYWGQGSFEVQRAIMEDLGDDLKIAVIGPAGEKLVKIACITAEFGRNAGRTGMGAVLGSKKVKAIAVKGTGDIPVADIDSLHDVVWEAWSYLMGHPLMEMWQRQGTSQVVVWANECGVFPTNNFLDGYFEHGKDISGDALEKRFKKVDRGCFACPMVCGQYTVAEEGPYRGYGIEGPEYETLSMLGSNTGIRDLNTIIYANYLCDDLGVDTISIGNLAGLAMEMYERRIITERDLENLKLKFGNDEALIEFINMLANRRGIGDVFAEGIKEVVRRWPEVEKFAMHAKGLEQSAYDTRAAPSMALAYATSDIGAHHNRAWTIAKDLELEPKKYRERAELVIFHQHIRPLFDSLGVCRLPWIELGIDVEYYARFYSAATGIETKLEELLRRSEAVYNVTRAINVAHGISRKDDYPPGRNFIDPVKSGPRKGALLTREEYEKLLDTYYELRGWDKTTGIPTAKKLEELGIGDVVKGLKKLGFDLGG